MKTSKLDSAYTAWMESKGSDESIERLYQALIDLSSALHYKFFKRFDSDLAADVASEIWLSLESYKGTAKFSTWAYKIARRILFREVKVNREREQREVSLEDVKDIAVEPSIEEGIYLRELYDQLDKDDKVAMEAMLKGYTRQDLIKNDLAVEDWTFRQLYNKLKKQQRRDLQHAK